MLNRKMVKKLIYGLVLISIIIYRSYLIVTYCAKYIDDDQAVMWYGTVALSHGILKEPHFYGQAYGSMMESLFAVPFHLINIPLNFALPLTTNVLWLLPFLILSIKAYHKNYSFSILILLSALLMNYDYDVLTSIPRSFISGFFLTFIGGLLFVESRKKLFTGLGIICMFLGFISTETSISVIGIFVLYSIIYSEDIKQKIFPSILAGIPSLALLYYCNEWFYRLNPEYDLHVSNFSVIRWANFVNNIRNLGSTLSSFSVFNLWIVPVIGLCGLMILFIIKKQYRMLIIFLSMVVGSLGFFALSKTSDYRPTILFSQTRMFLFFLYLIILLLYFMAENPAFYKNYQFFNSPGIVPICALLLIALVSYKIVIFKQVLKTENNWLTRDMILSVQAVEKIQTSSQQVEEIAREVKPQLIVVVSDTRGFGYALSALDFDDSTFYNAFYDRRTWIYLDEKSKKRTGKVLLISYGNPQIESEVITLHHESIIDWLFENRGLERYPKSNPRYVKPPVDPASN